MTMTIDECLRSDTQQGYELVEAMILSGQINSGRLAELMVAHPAFAAWLQKRSEERSIMNSDLLKAQDIISALEQERNILANRLVHVQAEMAALRRRNTELEVAASAAAARDDAQSVPPAANGHANQGEARQ